MKILQLIIFSFLIFNLSHAQSDSSAVAAKPWVFGGKPGVKWSRNSYNNWALGAIGNSTIEFDTKLKAHYKNDSVTWNNDLDMEYGFNRRDNEGKRKVVDKLDFRSHYSRVGPNKKFRYSGMFNLKSQFADGYNYQSNTQWYLQSGFFAPGYIKIDVGLDYIAIKHLTVHLSPFAEKTTIVSKAYYDKKVVNVFYDGWEPSFSEEEYGTQPAPSQADLDAIELRLDSTTTYGLAWRETSRFEVGAAVQVVYDYPNILKNIDFKTRLDIFAGYGSLKSPDLDWEIWLAFHFNKYIAFNVNAQLLYDGDQFSKFQFRDFVGVGLSYTIK